MDVSIYLSTVRHEGFPDQKVVLMFRTESGRIYSFILLLRSFIPLWLGIGLDFEEHIFHIGRFVNVSFLRSGSRYCVLIVMVLVVLVAAAATGATWFKQAFFATASS
jgi:hypothetical protein